MSILNKLSGWRTKLQRELKISDFRLEGHVSSGTWRIILKKQSYELR